VLDLNETVGAMLTMLRRLIGEDVTLLWRPSKNPWRIKVDPSQIDQFWPISASTLGTPSRAWAR